MAKKKDEKDVLVVRDEKTGEISVVAGLNADGDVYKRQVYKHMQEFLDIRYHVKDIALKELTPAFISDFETHSLMFPASSGIMKRSHEPEKNHPCGYGCLLRIHRTAGPVSYTHL